MEKNENFKIWEKAESLIWNVDKMVILPYFLKKPFFDKNLGFFEKKSNFFFKIGEKVANGIQNASKRVSFPQKAF